MAEDWKLQVSYKTPGGDMINIRANTADELSVLLEGIGDYATQIAAVQKLVVGASNTAPLSTPSSTTSIKPPQSLTPPQASAPSATSAPTCQHGARKYKSGISSKTGNPYAMWVCPMPQGADQCKPIN
ncbi:hypothetical protein EB001_10915 [bacterium]|nr:hypothetical protein [bacterium]